MPALKRTFSKRRATVKQRHAKAIQQISRPLAFPKNYSYSSRRSSLGFPDVVRTTMRYHDSTISIDAGIGLTAVHVFRLNR